VVDNSPVRGFSQDHQVVFLKITSPASQGAGRFASFYGLRKIKCHAWFFSRSPGGFSQDHITSEPGGGQICVFLWIA
jgi:hypothetical protein